MQQPKYKQTLRGTFKANVIPRGQCGFQVGQQEFNFTVSIGVNDLDENGWITDNRSLDNVISDAFSDGHWEASCEDLAGGILCTVYGLVGVGRVESISATVSPNQFADLQVNWVLGDSLPKWKPRAVPATADAPQTAPTGKLVAA